MTLGALIDALAQRPQEQRLTFEFGAMQPTTLKSYRGDYCDLAIGYDLPWVGPSAVTVAGFLEKCREVENSTLEGYKGGMFTMTRDTEVWVANWGKTASTALSGVTGNDYASRLVTTYRED